jgi:hypothetical protein
MDPYGVLTDSEINLVKNLNAGEKVMSHLNKKIEAAKTAKTLLAQATHSQEILYVLRDYSSAYKKSETWGLNCEIIHNSEFFVGVKIVY